MMQLYKYYVEQQVFPIWTRIGKYYNTEKEAKEHLMSLHNQFPEQLFRLMKEWQMIEIVDYNTLDR